jgi:Uma2 family endonuclease
MFQEEQKYFSPEEYLALEEAAEFKSEYYQGEIFAMVGASVNHNRIVRNLLVALAEYLAAKPCEAFASDMRLLVKENGLYTYPDVMVVCGKLEFAEGRTDTLTNPTVIFEVLSKSTQDYDRGGKFALYRPIETFQDYVLVDQHCLQVEHFHRLEDGRWILQEFKAPEAEVLLDSIGVTIPLSRMYHKVDWME